jgi:hypothetical protein
MRIMVAIDDDVLEAAKAIARQRRVPVGKVISELARNSLRPAAASAERNGTRLLPVRSAGAVVTTDIVNELRDGTIGNLPLHDLLWDGSISLRREDIYGDDGC